MNSGESDPWTIGRVNFETNDGSLPGIELNGLTPDDLRSLFRLITSRGRVSADTKIWDNRLEKDVPLKSVTDPAGAVAAEVLDPFHFCASEISSDGVQLPVLGFFFFHNAIAIDYRMGSDWSRSRFLAFYSFLRELVSCATAAEVAPEKSEGPPDPDRFLASWNCYLEGSAKP